MCDNKGKADKNVGKSVKLMRTKRLTAQQNNDGRWILYSGEQRADGKRGRTMALSQLRMTTAIEDEGR